MSLVRAQQGEPKQKPEAIASGFVLAPFPRRSRLGDTHSQRSDPTKLELTGMFFVFARKMLAARARKTPQFDAFAANLFIQGGAGSASRRSESRVALCARRSLASMLALDRTSLAKTCHRHFFATLTQQGGHIGATILYPNTKVLINQGLFVFLGVKNTPPSPLHLFSDLMDLNR